MVRTSVCDIPSDGAHMYAILLFQTIACRRRRRPIIFKTEIFIVRNRSVDMRSALYNYDKKCKIDKEGKGGLENNSGFVYVRNVYSQ